MKQIFLRKEYMKKIFIVLLLMALVIPVFAGVLNNAESDSPRGNLKPEVIMGYCTRADLEAAYGEDRIVGWSRMDSNAADRAIRNASAEIDGYLISGGYAVPISGPPENLRKYCIDIAAANLVLSAGVLDNDPGGKAIIEEAKNARQFLAKVAEGKFKIPGYTSGDDEVSTPSGGVMVSTMPRLDLKGF
jgi:phage gp36-like protein